MFSFSKKKDKKRDRGRDSEENEFGIKLDKGPDDKQLEAELRKLAGVDSLPEDDLNLNEEEEDEEAELLRLIGGGKGKKPAKKPTSPDVPIGDISELTAEIDLGDEDVEVDENDPDLLGELLELTNPEEAGMDMEEEEEEEEESETPQPAGSAPDILTTLKERLKLYKTAEAKAKENNESSRARRFARGIKTLEDLLKKAKAGKPVSPGDIPPEIALNLKPAPPPAPAEPEIPNGQPEELEESEQPERPKRPEPTSQPGDIMSTLIERLQMYKTAEAKAKETGETTRARRFGRGIKTLESLIKQARAGNQISPEEIPPAVALNLKPVPPVPVEPQPEEEEEEENEMGNVNLTEEPEPEKTSEPEKNIMDVLSERLSMYKTAEAKAKESGETSRARRFGRGIKTIQDLIKQATAGKPISPEDIPPEIAMNLKPAPPPPIVTTEEEQEPRDSGVERENLVRSPNQPEKLAFAPVDDVDLNAELGDEEEEEEETPTTVLEGLEQRVRLYSKFKDRAREDGNMALAEQNEKIVRVYLNAIRSYKKGDFVDVERLPNPRGCPPIPIPFYVP